MKAKTKKAVAPQLDLKDPPVETKAEAPKEEFNSFRGGGGPGGRRSLFRDRREGEAA